MKGKNGCGSHLFRLVQKKITLEYTLVLVLLTVRRGFFPSSFAPDHHSMAITRCQRQKQIVLVCFENSLSLLVQVDRVNAEGTLRATYPIATNLVYLPDSFLPIVNYLRYKANGST